MPFFKEENIPYKELSEVGITKEAFLNFPISILDKLLTGNLSPFIFCKMKVEQKIFNFLSKLLIIENNGNLQLKLFPVKKELDTKIPLTKKERQALENGRVIKKRITENNKRIYSYLQLDQDTNNIIKCYVNNLYIPQSFNNIALSKKEIKEISEAKVIEIKNERERYAVGINLVENNKFTCIKGNITEWEREAQRKWERENKDTIEYWNWDENMKSWIYKKEYIKEVNHKLFLKNRQNGKQS